MKAATKNNHWVEKAKFFLLGMIVVIGFLILTGAVGNTPGRYQLEAWGAGGIGFGAFVTDTVSGETKIVYLNTGMQTSQANYLATPFDAIKVNAR
ncbi:MAG: hypothetical protein P8X85_10425 [Desulfobacterales bacterium]|jgi:hypothetical protein